MNLYDGFKTYFLKINQTQRNNIQDIYSISNVATELSMQALAHSAHFRHSPGTLTSVSMIPDLYYGMLYSLD